MGSMRATFLAFVAAALLTAGVFASSAFNDAGVAQRRIVFNVVGDASAYVKLAGNGAAISTVFTKGIGKAHGNAPR